jgi:4-hydroxybutyrate dehydrogenase / sulfolactaldehyde 3-reductase
MNDMRVGFIGLGTMGRPMVRNVLSGGYQVTVYDTDPKAVAVLAADGAAVAPSCRELAEVSDLVITMVPTPADVEAAVLGQEGVADGVADGLARGGIVVDMSTGDPQVAQRLAGSLAEEGIDVLDCPVGRTQEHAEAGTLLLLAGGHDAVIDRAAPVLMCMGEELIRCGGHGMGQAMKLVNNMLALVLTQGVGEALALGLGAGLSVDLIRSVTAKTLAQTRQLDAALPAKAFTGDLTPGFALRLAEKDIRLATALAERLEVPVPLAERTLRQCAELSAAGHADHDIGVIVTAQAPQTVGGVGASRGSP